MLKIDLKCLKCYSPRGSRQGVAAETDSDAKKLDNDISFFFIIEGKW